MPEGWTSQRMRGPEVDAEVGELPTARIKDHVVRSETVHPSRQGALDDFWAPTLEGDGYPSYRTPG